MFFGRSSRAKEHFAIPPPRYPSSADLVYPTDSNGPASRPARGGWWRGRAKGDPELERRRQIAKEKEEERKAILNSFDEDPDYKNDGDGSWAFMLSLIAGLWIAAS